MNQANSYQQTLEQANADFIRELDNRIRWQWDAQFNCLLSEFSVDHQQHVYLTASKHFPYSWDKSSIRKANPQLRHRAGFFSQLQKQQALMAKDESGRNDYMLSWWPWGHGATVSVRIFSANTAPYQPPTGLFAKLKQCWS